MQTLILSLILFVFSAFGAFGQANYEDQMAQAFDLWKKGEPVEAANLFERIATAEQHWLPYYYASQVKIVESFPMTDVVKKEQTLKEAQRLLDRAKSLEGDEVELMVLQAMLHTATLTIDPSIYAMKLSPVISGIYAEAFQKAPENPRLALSRTEWNLGSARYFGEDPTRYCPDLKAALELYAQETHAATVAPAWGKERLQMLISTTCGEQ